MTPPWVTLRAAGVPLGVLRQRKATRLADIDVQSALVAIAHTPLDEQEATALAAWLRGFRHHWPAHFARAAGPVGDALATHLATRVHDDTNRYLKLRRIAIANLARLASEGTWVRNVGA